LGLAEATQKAGAGQTFVVGCTDRRQRQVLADVVQRRFATKNVCLRWVLWKSNPLQKVACFQSHASDATVRRLGAFVCPAASFFSFNHIFELFIFSM
jgi:hypothetical protein